MSDPQPFEAMVGQILTGKAPRQVKLAASRGALPLPRAALVRLFVSLRTDEDEEVRASAQGSLDALDKPLIREVLEDEGCAPEVLDHFAAAAARDEELAERIAFHRAVPNAALAKLASEGNGRVIDLVLTNQERLLTQAGLLDRLTANPALQPEQRGRILELLERVTRIQARAAGEETDERRAEEEPDDLEEAARLLNVDVGQLFSASEIVDGEEFADSEDPMIRTAYARILTLNVAQKAVLAMRGGREERMILIRDTNQIVALAVLRNGRITEDDVEAMARMRNVSTEVLRVIGQNREWAKNYSIVHNLVRNPRTPPGVSTNFIPRLQNSHLKTLQASHDAPELIRRMAKRTLSVRTQKKTILKKH